MMSVLPQMGGCCFAQILVVYQFFAIWQDMLTTSVLITISVLILMVKSILLDTTFFVSLKSLLLTR